MEKKQIGVLAVQGAFAEHTAMLDELGEPWFELRLPNTLPWYGDWAQRRLRSGSFRIWSGRWTD